MTAEEIDVFELAEKLMASESIEASVWLIKEYANQEARKAFEACQELKDIEDGGGMFIYPTYDDYKKQNHE